MARLVILDVTGTDRKCPQAPKFELSQVDKVGRSLEILHDEVQDKPAVPSMPYWFRMRSTRWPISASEMYGETARGNQP